MFPDGLENGGERCLLLLLLLLDRLRRKRRGRVEYGRD